MQVIPIVDLGELGLDNSTKCEPSEEEWQRVSKEIRDAFTDIGFLYLTNHGIAQDLIDKVFSAAGEFFSLDAATKTRYSRGVQSIQGYTGPDQERLSEVQGVHELRESFDVHTLTGTFPDAEVAGLRPAVEEFLNRCHLVSLSLLTAMALALGLEKYYFLKRHRRIKSDDNASCLRLLYYQALPDHDGDSDSTTTRCGAHTDYGTMTLLFQDQSGGLEVKDRAGSWVSAPPIPGAILVNAGDILQFWTADRFIATEHRVLLSGSRAAPRQSMALFVHPDGDVIVSPIDGSDAYTPVVAKEHTRKRFEDTYTQ